MIGRRGVVAVSVGALVAAAGAVQLLPGGAPVASAGLTAYSSCQELLAYYRSEVRATASPYGLGFGYGEQVGGVATDTTAAAGAPRAAGESAAVGAGATGTNLQEQGVDEPDLVKLKDGRLVVLAQDVLRVLSAEAQPRLLGSLRLGGAAPTYGAELLLVGDRVLVVVPGYREDPRPPDSPQTDASRLSSLYLPGVATTRVLLADLSSDDPRLLEEATYDGRYVSARLVGSTVRLVTATSPKTIGVQPMAAGPVAEQEALAANQQAADSLRLADVLPQVVRTDADGTVLQRGNAVGCTQTTHARSARGASTLLVTTMQPGEGLAATDSTAVTTDGDLVYASGERLYVATSRWGTVGPVRLMGDSVTGEVSTEIHAFDTSSATSTRYVGSGSVPGFVLGRWALSEFEGDLRVATTRQAPWTGEPGPGTDTAPDTATDTTPDIAPDIAPAGETSSMVVRLAERDGALVETGRVEGLGRTEQIRAVRYFGDVAVVVTFRQTDPLYLLDLSGTPRVLGELKVPGFSTYLHPIGDGMLLGLGQDADENGQVTGMQLSVFDISDLRHPSLVDRLPIGYGWSPAMDDSRAFGYDPDSRLAVFAFSGYDPAGGTMEAPSALGISVGEDGALREVGRMTGDPTSPPSRVLLDGERVYSVGETGVVAGEADTMTRTGSVSLSRP